MGRVLAVLAAMFLLACPAFAADDTINPSKWSKNQWRSDLFDTYPTYQRHNRVLVIRHETRIHTVVLQSDATDSQATIEPAPARPRLIRIGDTETGRASVRTVAGAARGCLGMLVITWAGDRAVSKCKRASSSAPRVETP